MLIDLVSEIIRLSDKLEKLDTEASICPGCGKARDIWLVKDIGARYVCFNHRCPEYARVPKQKEEK